MRMANVRPSHHTGSMLSGVTAQDSKESTIVVISDLHSFFSPHHPSVCTESRLLRVQIRLHTQFHYPENNYFMTNRKPADH